MNFYKLGVSPELVYALETMDISTPTPIQTLSIPEILKGKDVLGEAQTGTGKTLAFLLPLFQTIDLDSLTVQGVIITPTRELAIQIADVAEKLSKIIPVRILLSYGGKDVIAQLHKHGGNVQLVIGTPGRTLDYLRRGSVSFDNVKTLVVDEADQMFNIGFKKEMDEIISYTPKVRQTLCYSATLSQSVDVFSSTSLKNPVVVKAPKKQITLDTIEQFVVVTSSRKKYADFRKVLAQNYPQKAMIFCRSRIGSERLYEEMERDGYSVGVLHGGLTQAKREKTMNLFRNDKFQYLVATDVAARGLDIEGISHIFNYNLPDDTENYVHRIGRTGRAGMYGVAYTFLTQKDEERMIAIEDFINMKIKRIKV